MGKGQPSLPVGLVGISCETIDNKKKGWCWFPVGEYDPKLRRVSWIRCEVTAIEDIRANRDVIIANDQEGCKEHTPVELSYQSRAGPYQRVTEDYPLPTTMGSKAITYADPVVCTALNYTTLIEAPGSGYRIRVHYFSISNAHAAAVTVGMRFGTGNVKHRHTLAATGGNVNANLTDCCWEGGNNEALDAWLLAAYAGGVVFNIGYSVEAV